MPTKWCVKKDPADGRWAAWRGGAVALTLTWWSDWKTAHWYANTQAAREARL